MRIVSLLPSATEIVCALGLESALVGVTHECDFPPEVASLPKLTRTLLEPEPKPGETAAAAIDRAVSERLKSGAQLYAVDEELLVSLAPDVIFTQKLCSVCGVSGTFVEELARSMPGKPAVVSMEPRSLEDVFENIRGAGAATATAERAERLVEELRERLRRLAASVAPLGKPKTLVLEWTDPPYGGGHWTPSLVEIAGGSPVCAFPGEYSQTIRWEDALAADPRVIVVVPCGLGIPATEAALGELERECEPWRSLRSGRRVALVDGNQFANRPGPRLVDTAELFAAAIHPDSVAPANGAHLKVLQ
jgi:iron complex transport system substrate-binding protein